MLDLLLCTVAYVTDGDTFRCRSGERIRLAGIDAPELHGCPAGRRCAPGSGEAARRQLERLVAGREVSCLPNGRSYNRITAFCVAGGIDLSCRMVASGHAIRLERYWRGHRC